MTNPQLSLEILENLGFNWKNGRLVLEYQSLDLTTMINKVKFCRFKYNISLKLQQVVVKIIHNNVHKIQNIQNSSNESVPLYANVNKWLKFQSVLNHDELTRELPEKIRDVFDQVFDLYVSSDKFQKDGIDVACIVWRTYLFASNLPIPIVDSLLELIIKDTFDFTNKDDRLWFSKIFWDRVYSVEMHDLYDQCVAPLKKAVSKYVVDINITDMRAIREFADNLDTLFHNHTTRMHIYNTSHVNFNKQILLFEQNAEKYALKWIQFESESKRICKLLLSNNKYKSQWNCYNCNLVNENNINQCSRCNKGINPIFPAKQNKSQTFCVTKPFGLIKWNGYRSVCLCLILYFCYIFYFQKFPEIS